MRLSAKLLGFLNRAFNKDPEAYLALRLRYDGGMQWQVADGWLSTAVQGGTGAPLAIDLSQHTVASLAGVLSLASGYSVPYVADLDGRRASALRLLDGSGNQDTSNGDHIQAYSAILQAWIDANAVELDLAERAIALIPPEMNTREANGEWLDFQGSFYAVPRLPNEPDRLYGERIIAEVLRPLGNNVALEAAVSAYTGQSVTVTDVVFYREAEPRFNGATLFDGTRFFNPVAAPVYGLFDAVLGYDMLGGDEPVAFAVLLRTLFNRLRDAGTQLRALVLTGGVLEDSVIPPSDDDDELVLISSRRFDGSFNFNGREFFSGNYRDVGRIAGSLGVVEPLPETMMLLVTKDGVPIQLQVMDDGLKIQNVLVPSGY